MSLTRPITSLLAPYINEAAYDVLALEVLETGEGWGMGVV